jgi:hypothetical protein
LKIYKLGNFSFVKNISIKSGEIININKIFWGWLNEY